MPQKRKKLAAGGEDDASAGVSAMDKIVGLLALIATREMDKDAAALKLDAIGFGPQEISALLDVGSNYVHVARHRKRSGAKKPGKKG